MNRNRHRRGFTLIELVAVMVVIAVLVGVALPKFFDWRNEARASASDGAIAAMTTALEMAHVHNRMLDAAAADWVLNVTDIADTMEMGVLPEGVTISGTSIFDPEGQEYTLTAETLASPAQIVAVP